MFCLKYAYFQLLSIHVMKQAQLSIAIDFLKCHLGHHVILRSFYTSVPFWLSYLLECLMCSAQYQPKRSGCEPFFYNTDLAAT